MACAQSVPWVHGLEKKYGSKGLQIIGVHTPEFAYEKDRPRVEAATRRHGITFPVMMDNDRSYWQALATRYWPTFYLVDRTGKVVKRFEGLMKAGRPRSQNAEQVLEDLLTAAPPLPTPSPQKLSLK